MSNTWRYVSEARGHLVEVYEDLLGAALDRESDYWSAKSYDAEKHKAEMKAAEEWEQTRLSMLMRVVEVLKKYDVKKALGDWQPHAIAFLEKTPSARAKQRFISEDDRILFLCVALEWRGRDPAGEIAPARAGRDLGPAPEPAWRAGRWPAGRDTSV